MPPGVLAALDAGWWFHEQSGSNFGGMPGDVSEGLLVKAGRWAGRGLSRTIAGPRGRRREAAAAAEKQNSSSGRPRMLHLRFNGRAGVRSENGNSCVLFLSQLPAGLARRDLCLSEQLGCCRRHLIMSLWAFAESSRAFVSA